MRMNLPDSLRVGLLPILFFSFLHSTLAGIRPSFSLDYCSWHATDIVFVEATPPAGAFRVVESWKGDSETGSLVVIPQLRPATGAMEIAAYPKTLRVGLNEQIPAQHVGARMVLFLEKTTALSGSQWNPAALFGEMKTSTVWIDGGRIYAFQQVMNPGPSILVPWHMSLDRMKDRVKEIRRMQLEMAKVTAIEDGAAKAEGLKVYVGSDVREAQQLALSELGKCGPQALTAIRGMLSDPTFADDDAELVKVFAEVGGEAVGKELDSRLQVQLRFWQATAPTLSIGWWNQDATPHQANPGASACARPRSLPSGFDYGRAAWKSLAFFSTVSSQVANI